MPLSPVILIPPPPGPRLTDGRRCGSVAIESELRKDVRDFMNITKALADENRVRIVLALRARELCVCQITELFGLAPSTISKHLSILYQAGLVESRKDGRWIYYRLPDKSAPAAIRRALDWVHRALERNSQILSDEKTLVKILALDPVELCKRV